MPSAPDIRSASSILAPVGSDPNGFADLGRRPRGRRAVAAVAATGLVVGLLSLVVPSTASADPTANDWLRLRTCESSDNYRTNTGNGHYGAYQFDLATWRSVGGHGLPSDASKAEQDERALILYHQRGWQPWQCASILDLPVRPGTSSAPAPSAAGSHAWPGVYYNLGDHSSHLAQWQKQMGKRGAPLQGTGQFGPITLSVVEQLQRQNGLPANGTLGPLTWPLAWTGSYHRPAAPVKAKPKPKPKPAKPQPKPVKAKPKAAPKPAPAAPKWPGVDYGIGAWNSHVAAWQKQMRKRGADLQGTGEFGLRTAAVARQLQRQNGLDPVGYIGPATWKLAWTGKYHA